MQSSKSTTWLQGGHGQPSKVLSYDLEYFDFGIKIDNSTEGVGMVSKLQVN